MKRVCHRGRGPERHSIAPFFRSPYWFFLVGAFIFIGNKSAFSETVVSQFLPARVTAAGSPYLVMADQQVRAGDVLTIDPGAELRFAPGTGLTVAGTLIARGTAALPIRFTSLQAGTTAAASGQWRGIVLQFPTSVNSQVEYIETRYADIGITLHNSSASVTSSVFRDSGRIGLWIYGDSGPDILQNQFIQNREWGMVVNAPIRVLDKNLFDGNQSAIQFGYAIGAPIMKNCAFRDTQSDLIDLYPDVYLVDGGGNTFDVSNKINGIDLLGNWDASGTFGFASLPYLVRKGAITIQPGTASGALTIGPGVVVKSQNVPLFVRVTLLALGSADRPITFTSLFDDSVGGHVIRGDTTQPKPGDWQGLILTGIESSASRLDRVHSRYGGSSNLTLRNSAARVSNSEFKFGAPWGVVFAGDQISSLSSSTVTGSETYGVRVENTVSQEVHFNQIFGNGNREGLQGVTMDARVHAQNNYWGDPSGPSGLGPGIGDAVAGNVDFLPFLTSTPTAPSEDALPPRTRLLATPFAGNNPIAVGIRSAIQLSAVDDRSSVGDGLGNGVASTKVSIDNGPYSVYAATFSIAQPGVHQLSFFSTDVNAHSETAQLSDVFVDTQPLVSQPRYSTIPYKDELGREYISNATVIQIATLPSTAPVASLQISVDSAAFVPVTGNVTLSEGLHRLLLQSTDVLGNVELPNPFTIAIDSTPPVSRLTVTGSTQTLPDGSIGAQFPPEVAIAAIDPTSANLASGIDKIHVAVDTDTFVVYTGSFVLTGAGRHAIRWFAVDHVNNAEAAHMLSVVVSTASGGAEGLAPETALQISPSSFTDTSGRLYASALATFVFTVNDHGLGTAFTQYAVDGSSTALFSNPFLLTGGTHTLRFRSQDLSGQLEPLRSVSLWIDGAPPVSVLLTSLPAAALANGELAITTATVMNFSAVDVSSFGVISGVRDIQWSGDSAPFQTFTSSFSQPGEGAHRLQWVSHDNAGNEEPLRSASIVVDATPPTIQISLSPDAVVSGSQLWADTATAVGFAISDALTGVATAQYRIDAVNGSSFLAYTTPFHLDPGTHTLEARAWDNAGNLKTVAPFSIFVSTTAPEAPGADPTGGTLPDGTPVTGSPTPVPVPPPGAAPMPPPTQPVVSAVTFSPSSTLLSGNFTVAVRFSVPMDNTRSPLVTARLPGSSAPMRLQLTSYVADTWRGTGTVPADAESGAGSLSVSGAQSIDGRPIPQSQFDFQVNNARLGAPTGVQADVAGSTEAVRIRWSPLAGVSHYRVYQASAPFTRVTGLRPIAGVDVTEAYATPSMNIARAYFGVTAIGSDDVEGPLSTIVSFPMPLPPIITFPLPNANVDVSSTLLRGIAQPGATLLLSASVSSGTLATATADNAGRWTSPIMLGIGDFNVLAKAQSPVTLQISSAAAVALHVGVLPLAPANLTARADDTTVTLTWTTSMQPNVRGYNVYRDNGEVSLNAVVLPVNQSSFTDFALTDGREYSYLLTAVRADGVESSASNSVHAVPVAGGSWTR